MSYLLAADVGGTKTHLGLYRHDARELTLVAERRYPSRDFARFGDIVARFRAEVPETEGAPLEATGIGVAGPVLDRRCQATNLPWGIDARALEAEGSLGRIALVNDFKAAALGVLHLRAGDWVDLNPAAKAEPDAPIAVLGAGTGLGEAFLIHTGERYLVVPSEGGHTDFAPRNEEEIGLLRFMLKRHRRVSTERVVSGAGLSAIYEYLLDSGYHAEAPAVRAALEASGDAPAVVSEWGLAGKDPVCVKALDMFVALYGAEAGNLALKVIARGGIYVTGGIAPKNLAKLQSGGFFSAFADKGRFSPLVASMPVRVVTHPAVSLLGAAAAVFEPGA